MTTSIPLHICLRVLQRLQIFGNNLWEQLKTTILNFQKSPVKSGFVAVGTSSNFTTFRVEAVITTSILLPMYLTARTKGANLWEHPLGTDKIEYIKF